jgi:hypothetical protein
MKKGLVPTYPPTALIRRRYLPILGLTLICTYVGKPLERFSCCPLGLPYPLPPAKPATGLLAAAIHAKKAPETGAEGIGRAKEPYFESGAVLLKERGRLGEKLGDRLTED